MFWPASSATKIEGFLINIDWQLSAGHIILGPRLSKLMMLEEKMGRYFLAFGSYCQLTRKACYNWHQGECDQRQ